jgi:hypothetical protein
MAHLVTVTDLNNHELLFNLDTVVSMERGQNDHTIVTTRWGRTDIKETLEEIKSLSQESSLEYPSNFFASQIEPENPHN